MKFKIKDNFIMALFEEGEDPQKNLIELAKNVDSNLVILSAIGMIENPEIGYFNGTEYETKVFEGCFELLGYHGNVVNSDNGFTSHIHITIADENHQVYGGHLLSGHVHLMNEVILGILKEKFIKAFDEKTTLNLWSL